MEMGRERTKPRRCSRPLVSFACLKLATIVSFLWNCLFLMDTSILTISCQTTRPAPMFKCLSSLYQPKLVQARRERRGNAPDFRVAHQAFAETDRRSVSSERTIRVFCSDRVHVRRRASRDRIALSTFFRRNTPSIVDAIIVNVSIPPNTTITRSRKNSTHMRQTLFLTWTIVFGE